MLTLEILQAKDGDCLLLHYKSGGTDQLILIDGGPSEVYPCVLEKRLNEIRGDQSQLKLRLVVVSHIDADHITGIRDLFRKMEKMEDEQRQSPWFTIRSVWHNAFGQVLSPHGAALPAVVTASLSEGSLPPGLEKDVQAVVTSIPQGNEVQRLARRYSMINREFKGQMIVAPEHGRLEVKIGAGLVLTILGPHQKELNRLKDKWEEARQKHKTSDQAATADYLNRTVPNLSSIVFLAEENDGAAKTTRMLLTGDAGGDLILEGLESAGLLDQQGQIKVDILKVQHHGSNHSVDAGFFTKVIADVYVISGNGKHGIPHLDVLGWLSKARKGERIDVYMTNRHLQDGNRDYSDDLSKFLQAESEDEPNHIYHFIEGGALSIAVA